MDLQIFERAVGTATILDLHGSVNILNSQEIGAKFESLIQEGKIHVVLNLEGVQHVDSSGLGTFIKGKQNLRDSLGNMATVNVPEDVMHVFKVAGLIAFFNIRESEEDAVAFFEHG